MVFPVAKRRDRRFVLSVSRKRIAVRLWLGSVIGTLLSMWAPIPFAFLRGFGITAHIAAAIFALALHALWFARRGKTVPCAEDAAIDRPLPYLLVPFMVLAIYLVGSHTLQTWTERSIPGNVPTAIWRCI